MAHKLFSGNVLPEEIFLPGKILSKAGVYYCSKIYKLYFQQLTGALPPVQ